MGGGRGRGRTGTGEDGDGGGQGRGRMGTGEDGDRGGRGPGEDRGRGRTRTGEDGDRGGQGPGVCKRNAYEKPPGVTDRMGPSGRVASVGRGVPFSEPPSDGARTAALGLAETPPDERSLLAALRVGAGGGQASGRDRRDADRGLQELADQCEAAGEETGQCGRGPSFCLGERGTQRPVAKLGGTQLRQKRKAQVWSLRGTCCEPPADFSEIGAPGRGTGRSEQGTGQITWG